MTRRRFLVAPLAALLASAAMLRAEEFPVTAAADFQAAVNSAGPDDVVTVGPGTWNDVRIRVNHGGTEDHPLVIRCENPGETVLGGDSFLEINAPHVTVDGLFFHKGAMAGRNDLGVITFSSHHGIVRNTAIVDFNPRSVDTAYYWVLFNGDNNLLDHCYFKGKNNLLPTIGNALDKSRGNTVLRCHFKNIPFDTANGRECIRVWGEGKFAPKDRGGAYFTIRENLFEDADGEGAEIISLKSNHNGVISNTVISTMGCINIRRGEHNTVEGNIILGKGKQGAQGIRVAGAHNAVRGNYISGCESGFRIMAGEFIQYRLSGGYQLQIKAGAKKHKPGSIGLVPTYPQVKELELTGNVCAANSGPDLDLGFGYRKHWPHKQIVLLPEECLFKENRFVRPRGGDSLIGVLADNEPFLSQFIFKPNLFENNVLVGGTNAYPPADDGCRTVPLPAGWTEAQERAAFRPLTPEEVGPPWIAALRKAGKFPMEQEDSRARKAAGGQ